MITKLPAASSRREDDKLDDSSVGPRRPGTLDKVDGEILYFEGRSAKPFGVVGNSCNLDAATVTSLTRGVKMAEKSPNQHNVKKVGKSLKEKRNEKNAKKVSKKNLGG